LLSSSGAAGDPQSYFRAEDEASWHVEDTEARYPHAALLDIELADWYRIP